MAKAKAYKRKFQTGLDVEMSRRLEQMMRKYNMIEAEILRRMIRIFIRLDDHGVTIWKMLDCVDMIVKCLLGAKKEAAKNDSDSDKK